MVLNNNIEKITSIGGKFKYKMDCINPSCINKVEIIESTFLKKENDNGIKYFACCRNCGYSKFAMDLQKDNLKKKYGVENVFQKNDVKEKIKQTNLKRYGVENTFQRDDIKEKINTKLDRSKMGKKAFETRKEKYELLGAVPKKETIKTNNKKYGVDYYFQTDIGKMNLDGFIKRHDIHGKRLYLEKNKKCAITLNNMINKYGEKEGLIKYESWKRKCVITLNNIINKYGEKEGLIKYESWFQSSIGKPSSGQISKISKQFFKELNINGKNEFYLFDKKNNKRYFYDFMYNSKIIEFNGDYWHCNPSKYNSDDIVKYPNNLIIEAKEIWSKDDKKYKFAKKQGFDLMIIWENDYKNGVIDFDKIKEFLND